jgi:hypothetical protein
MKPERTFTAQWIVGSLATAIVAAAGCVSPRKTEAQTDYAKEKTQIGQRLHEGIVAAETKDFGRLDSYHLYGPEFTKFTGSSPERLDAAAGREGEHKGLGAANGLKMRADALKIDIFGNVGIATFILNYSFESGGQTIGRKERSTLVFVNDGGAWKIVHEHLSPIKE